MGDATAAAASNHLSLVATDLRPRTVSTDLQPRDRSALSTEDEEVRRRRLYLNLGRPRPFYRRRGSDGGRIDAPGAMASRGREGAPGVVAASGRVDAPAVLRAEASRVDEPAVVAEGSGRSAEGHVRSDVRSLQEQGLLLICHCAPVFCANFSVNSFVAVNLYFYTGISREY
jgi:hypothetical protein